MSTLVGDLIISARTIIPDMPGVIAPPTAGSGAGVGGAGTGFDDGYHSLVVTALTPWGETTPSPTFQVQTTAPGLTHMNVSCSAVVSATAYRYYMGNYYIEFPVNSASFIASPASFTGIGTPPTINRAYLPDSDGLIFPAITLYGWLREALNLGADITGGIYDVTGVNTTVEVAMYQVDRQWKKFTHAWWDGWQLGLGNKGDAFYRNRIDATSGIVFTDVRGKAAIIEYYPIPNRSGGSSPLTTAISATDTTLSIDTTGWLLQYGVARVENEIVAYQAMTGGTLVGCLRGLGGTVAATHAEAATVKELNGRFAGYRYPVIPRVGDSALELDVPASWDAWLPMYLESRYREAERRFKEAAELRKEFEAGLKRNASSVRAGLLMGPRQIGEQYVNEVYGSGAKMGGGWLLP